MRRFRLTIFLMLLSVSTAQEAEIILPLISTEQLSNSLDSVRQSLSRDGIWKAQLQLAGAFRDESNLVSKWSITSPESVTIDTVVLSGAEVLNNRTVAQILKGNTGYPADAASLRQLHNSIVSYPFIDKSGQPFYARLNEDKLSAVVPVQTDFSHSIIATAGYQPESDGNSQITGDIQIGLENPFGSASISKLWWNRKDEQSQRISLSYEDPFLWRFSIGGSFSFTQILQDGLYVQRETSAAVVIPRSFLGRWSFGGTEERVTITDEGDSLGLGGHSIRSIKVQNELDRRASRSNPTTGYLFRFDIGLGDFNPNESERTISLDIRSEGELLKPIFERITLSMAAWGGYFGLASGAVPLSEKLRYGGASSLRGYVEQAFEADWVVIGQIEMIYVMSTENRVYAFIDGAYDALNRTPASAGLGLQQKTPLGVLQLDYAVGRKDTPRDGKIHMRLINRF